MVIPAKVGNEERIAARRSEIVQAATDLFTDKGFHKTTIRDIAGALGWNMGTLYLYISQKEDVLYLVAQSCIDQRWRMVQQVQRQETARESLEAVAAAFFEAVGQDRRAIKLLYRESASLLPEHLRAVRQAELRDRDFIADVIRWGIDTGEFRPVDPDLFAHTIIMLGHMWALKGWSLWPGMSFEEYRDQQFALIFDHLCAPRPC
ncbi:MAG: TetR/AcrR family transcriptional regulator [Dehalococcoidia bacterium]